MKKILFAASFLGIVLMASFAGAQQSKTGSELPKKENSQAVRHVVLPRSEARNIRNLQHQALVSPADASSGNGVMSAADKRRIQHAEQMKAYEAYKTKN